MAENTVDVIIQILRKGQGAQETVADLEKLNKATAATGTAMTGLGSAAARAFAILGGTALLRSALNEFVESEKAISRLNAALRSSGQFTEAYSKELQALAKSFQDVTTYTDEAALNVISKLVAFGAPRESVARLTETVLDLATLLDKDLPRATLAMGKALQGEFGAFTMLGFKIDETKSSVENFNSILDQMSTRAGGQAKAAAASLGGEIDQLKNHFSDLKEEIGQALALLLNPAFKSIKFGEQAKPIASELKDLRAMRDELQARIEIETRLRPDGGGPELERLRKKLALAGENLPEAFVAAPGQKLDLEVMRNQLLQARAALESVQGGLGISAPAKAAAAAPISTPGLIAADAKKQAEELIKSKAEAEKFSDEIWEDAIRQEKELAQLRLDNEEQIRRAKEATHREEITATEQFQGRLVEIGQVAREQFAGGLANAIIEAFEGGEKAFQKFASSFMRQVAQMILQALILRAVSSAFGTGIFTGAAAGGQFQKFAGGGTASIAQPTYFPGFNVLAGEAGREIMTVLARPRTMDIGGMMAQVGDVGSQRMAIVNANQLAAKTAGGGGATTVEISLGKDLEGRIVRQSVRESNVKFVNDLRTESPASSAVKRLTA